MIDGVGILRLVRVGLTLVAAFTVAASAGPDPDRGIREMRPRASRPTTTQPESILGGVVVTDFDPHELLGTSSQLWLGLLDEGPFEAPRTGDLYVVAVLDRERAEADSIEQVTRFLRPDGSLHLQRRLSIEPFPGSPGRILRASLSEPLDNPENVARLGRLVRMLPPRLLASPAGRDPGLTVVSLPVARTWITRQRLWGTWTVDVSILRGEEVLGRAQASFVLVPGER